jgi:hypothetical protein
MTIRERLLELREEFFNFVAFSFQKLAGLFGFPDNPGMLLTPLKRYYWNPKSLAENLPIRTVRFPPDTHPQNYIEILIGDSPKPSPIPRIFYESNSDGFYSFYMENYKNIIFLPNWVSEFLQVQCHFCLDISFLEVCREVMFAILVTYYYMISFRIFIAWLISINPYTFPIAYFIAFVDWIEEYAIGLMPVVGGIGLATPLLLTLMGKAADSLNHLVFTMPFLPSEGVPGKAIVNGDVKDVLIFKYLPILWYKYPIPNEIREFWYNDRPDILKYMQEAYKNVDIQFLPDRIINKSNLFETSLKQISLNLNPLTDSTSNLLISTNFSNIQDISHSITQQFETYYSLVSNLNL